MNAQAHETEIATSPSRSPKPARTRKPKRTVEIVVEVAAWLWPRRRLVAAELRAAARRRRAKPSASPLPAQGGPRPLRFAV